MSALADPSLPVSYPGGPEALDLARAGLAGFTRFAEAWGLSGDQQRHLLGGLPKATFYGLLRGTVRTVNRDTLERLSLLAGIWIDLEILVPDREAALEWLRRPHPDPRFGGASPLAWMLQGSVSALVDVRRYLEEWSTSGEGAHPGRVARTRILWRRGGRLVPACYQAADLFERIPGLEAADHQPGLLRLASLSSVAGPGSIALLDPAKILFGPGAGWINFSFLRPRPGRFSTTRWGAFYLADGLETAIAEVRHHLQARLAREGIGTSMDLDYRALKVQVQGEFHDLRTRPAGRKPWAGLLDPDSYSASQAFALRPGMRAPPDWSTPACAGWKAVAPRSSIPMPCGPAGTTPI